MVETSKEIQKADGEISEEEAASLLESDYLKEYDNTEIEGVRSNVTVWIATSQQISDANERLFVQRYMAGKQEDKEKRASDMAKAEKTAEETLLPLRREISSRTQRIANLFLKRPALAYEVEVWRQLPSNLRRILVKLLADKGIEVSALIKRAEALEKEQDEKLIRLYKEAKPTN